MDFMKLSYLILIKLLCFLFLDVHAKSLTPKESKINMEIINKIGFDCRHLYNAVTKKKHRDRTKVLNASLNLSGKKIFEKYEIVRSSFTKCHDTDEVICKQELAMLNKEINFIKKWSEKAKKGGDAAVYWGSINLAFVVNHEVLKPSKEVFKKECSIKTINNDNCKKLRKYISEIMTIAADLSQESYSKVEGLAADKERINRIKTLLEKYATN